MNIRIVRKRHQQKEVLAEIYGASQDELPSKDEVILFGGGYQRVLTITKSYEVDKRGEHFQDSIQVLDNICWFEVDIT